MSEEPRILIGDHIYRIDCQFHTVTQVGNADNQISIDALQKHDHYYSVSVDKSTGQLFSGDQPSNAADIKIPRSILEDGYVEYSEFAENFNRQFADSTGVQLVAENLRDTLHDMTIPIPEQKFPIVSFNDFDYEVDASFMELRKVDEPLISISIRNLRQDNGQYLLYQDQKGELHSRPADGRILMPLNQLVNIAPAEISQVYGIPVDKLPARDDNLTYNRSYATERIDKGKLPIIRIVDEDFYIDTRLLQLRSCNKFWKTLPLKPDSYKSGDEQNKHLFLYDYLDRRLIPFTFEPSKLTNHSVLIELPDIITLDPVAAGRQIYDDPYGFLHRYPIQPQMEAKVIPIEKTKLLKQLKESKSSKTPIIGKQKRNEGNKRIKR